MMKTGLLKKTVAGLMAAVFWMGSWTGSLAYAYTVKSEYKQEEQIAEGVVLQNLSYITTDGNLNVDVLKVDLTNPYVKVGTVYGKDGVLRNTQAVSNLAKNNAAVAAVNAGFFEMDEKAPIGVTLHNGTIVSSPAQRNDMSSFTIDKNNLPAIDILQFAGVVKAPTGNTFTLFGVNKPEYLTTDGGNSIANRLNLYNRQWGTKSRGSSAKYKDVAEVVVANDVVVSMSRGNKGADIPSNGYVLSGDGLAATFLMQNFKVGAAVQVQYGIINGQDLISAVGGQSKIVDYGKRSYMPQIIAGKRARTAVGYTQDRKTMFLVAVEGNKNSRGMTQEELADYMICLGCWQALNLDGGGSTAMVARPLAEEQLALMNTPQEGVERLVPDGLAIFNTAPAGALWGLKLKGEKTVLFNTYSAYSAKGFDEHYNPYQVAPTEIVWSISPELGTFTGNVLHPTGGGEGTISATAQGITQTMPVKVIDSVYISGITATPSKIVLNEGDSLPLEVKVHTKMGDSIDIQPQYLTWSVTGDVGQVVGNKFVAGSQRAIGTLTGQLDQTVVNIPVVVGSLEQGAFYDFEQATGITFKGYPEVPGEVKVVGPSDPVYRGSGAVKLTYDFSRCQGTRAAYAQFDSGVTLPGQPLGFGLWVYGNGGQGHWLRAQVEDKYGVVKVVDLANQVNWQGWRKVTGKLPADLDAPIKIKSIYLVETDNQKKDAGSIYLDEMFTLQPITQDTLNAPDVVLPSAQGELTQTEELSLNAGQYKVDFSQGSVSQAAEVKLQAETTTLPSPGLRPVGNALRVSVSTQGELSKPYLLTATVPEALKKSDLALMRWDDKLGWVYVPQQATADGNLQSKCEQMGLYSLFSVHRGNSEFADITTSWARTEINQMAGRGLVKGISSSQFGPTQSVTRAQFVTMLVRAFGWNNVSGKLTFKDSIPDYAKDAVTIAVSKGIVDGYSDQTFRPNDRITRAQMAAMLDRALKLPDAATSARFTDDKQIPKWAKAAIDKTQTAGILQGNEGKFRPNDTATRAEATVVIYRMLQHYMKVS